MNDNSLLVILPIVIAIGNILMVFLVSREATTLLRKLGGLAITLILTLVTWFASAMPYIAGLADSATSCSHQVGYPGCRQFEEVTELFSQTLGNFNILLLLCIGDIVIVLVGWYRRV